MLLSAHLAGCCRGWLQLLPALLVSLFLLVPGEWGICGAFEPHVYQSTNGVRLPYQLHIPEPLDSSKQYPCILFLHGAIARGDDNREPLNWGPLLIRSNSLKVGLPCFIVAPQCPKTGSWMTPIAGKGTEPIQLAVSLVKNELPKAFKVDLSKCYITGVSMGGIGLWDFICEQPGVFAAAVPVCSAGSPNKVTAAAAKYPVWVFHSDDDHLIPVQSARSMVQAWKGKGGEARYTEYKGVRHSSWKPAYAEA
ncbi:MAG: hypothetical protein FJ405_14910, partial [Verrucomicrobia bacterium]|nr:hypothetical protein [Verrucomicrobiota bacterium]